MIRKVIKLLLIIVWMGIIFFFSMDTGEQSSTKSEGMVIHISEIFLGRSLSDSEKQTIIDHWDTPIRKTAHFLLYFILELFIILFLKEFHKLTIKDYFIATIWVFLYACSDEVHQLFVSERSGKIGDVLIDTMGGICCACGFYFIRRKKHGQEKTAS